MGVVVPLWVVLVLLRYYSNVQELLLPGGQGGSSELPLVHKMLVFD